MYLSEYILAQQDRDDNVGQLARDAAEDEGWPHQATAWALSRYLATDGAGEEAFVALQSAAREHRRQEFEAGG